MLGPFVMGRCSYYTTNQSLFICVVMLLCILCYCMYTSCSGTYMYTVRSRVRRQYLPFSFYPEKLSVLYKHIVSMFD